MRCSLLTLSTYLDSELAPDRAGEVEAHLVACQRCSSGLGYLREEKAHISALAAVLTDPGAAEDLLGTVGLQYLPGTAVDPPELAPQFLLDLAESPVPSPLPPAPDESGTYLELNGSPSEQAASAEPPEPVDTATEPRVEAQAEATADTSAAEPIDDERLEEPAPPVTPAPAAPPQWSTRYTPELSLAAPREPAPTVPPPVRETPETDPVVPEFLVDSAVDATEQAMVPPHPSTPKPSAPKPSAPMLSSPKPSSPSVALTGRAASWLGRARDAVSVRWALMRGS
ncbi:MAG: zf-HC2 domain-containing protein, partial [Candidatus Dormibacteraeota bacterium]|nr:zf-HC2 domain-containing protein [Candidatus Dormibacteraeota bacterium]